MKVRAAVTLAVAALVGAVVACGSSGESTFPGGGEGEGSSGAPPGFTVTDSGSTNTTSTSTCKKLTCDDQGVKCGPAGDGCGGKIDDCGKCSGVQTCGGGGTASVCGGTAGCVPRNCTQAGVECGFAGDGCGGVIDCNQPPFGCTGSQICGGGGPSKCGGGQVSADGGNPTLPDGGACQPRTACVTNECGPVADGCGGILNCPTICPAGTTCGGGNVPSMCGAPACTKKTCVQQNANCGYAADGCGGLLDCGGSLANFGCATAGESCGGGGPNRCGVPDAGPPACTGFCANQASCDAAAPTRITGRVFAPNGTLPIPGALVYVPNGSTSDPWGLTAFNDGVAGGTCQQCNSQISNALVSTTSGFNGNFTLDNVPAGVSFPLVIQLGRWRRVLTIPAITACTTRALVTTPASSVITRFPRTQGEGHALDHIPLVAISTGSVDGLECVFRKMGIAASQFSNPSGTGRIRLYRDNDGPGATIDGNTPNASTLYDSTTELDKFDAVAFACPAAPYTKTTTQKDNVRAYADKGGRVFATHFNYVWLFDNGPWAGTATWHTATPQSTQGDWEAQVDAVSGTKRELFAQWLAAPGVAATASCVGGTPAGTTCVQIDEPRNNADTPLGNGAERWLHGNSTPPGSSAVLHYTFNTPTSAASANQCGRVIFSDFHVSTGSTNGETAPSYCGSTLTAQEKILAFMLFDLTSCIQPTTPPSPPPCQKKSCAAQGIVCGKAGDGCGGFQDCDPCPTHQVCQNNQCITPPCNKTSCTAQSAECGIIADGCGSTLQCPPCEGGVCGGNGANKCGSASCQPIDCNVQGIECGPAGNGCGQLLDCGPCPPGQTCGGGGRYGKCGAPSCAPRTCESAGAKCGFLANGCGGLVDCGICPMGQTCGGVTPNQCSTTGGPN